MPESVRILRVPLGYTIAAGLVTGFCVSKTVMDLSTIQGQTVVLVVITICFLVALARQYPDDPKQVTRLAREIHTKAYRLTQNGHTVFADVHISVKRDVAVIYYVNWDECFDEEPCRWFEIKRTGEVSRYSRDQGWRTGNLPSQLQDLLDRLRGSVPYIAADRAHHEDR